MSAFRAYDLANILKPHDAELDAAPLGVIVVDAKGTDFGI